MTDRVSEALKSVLTIASSREGVELPTAVSAALSQNPSQVASLKPQAFAALLKEAMYSGLGDSLGEFGSQDSGLDAGLLGDLGNLSPLVLAMLMGTTLGGPPSQTLNALLGTEPRRNPLPNSPDGRRTATGIWDVFTGATSAPWLVIEPWSAAGPTAVGAYPMSLGQFPRPAGDNGRGMHWIPTISQDKGVIDRFVRELQAMHIKWAVILNGGTDSGRNDYLVDRLTQAGIMPVMRIYTPGLQSMSPDELESMVRHYRSKGVYYYQIYNEPNLRYENGGREPDVSRYLDHWIPAARAVERAGGLPGFGALSPGGDVDDLQFLREALRELKRRGQVGVLDRAWLSVHNYAGHHPIATSDGDWGFFRYRRYNDIIWDELGRYMPMIGTEGGSYPSGDFTVEEQVASARQSYAYMAHREPYFLAYSYWLIANEAGGGHDKTFSYQALFRPDGVSPVVKALKEL